MKRLTLICLLLLPLAAWSQGSLYQRYASQDGLTVAQVSGFRLTDSVRVDVVLVVADNQTAWDRLSDELDLRDDEGITSWLGDVDRPAERTRWHGQPLLRIVASPARRTVGFYRVDSEAQLDALIDYQLTQSQKNKKK